MDEFSNLSYEELCQFVIKFCDSPNHSHSIATIAYNGLDLFDYIEKNMPPLLYFTNMTLMFGYNYKGNFIELLYKYWCSDHISFDKKELLWLINFENTFIDSDKPIEFINDMNLSCVDICLLLKTSDCPNWISYLDNNWNCSEIRQRNIENELIHIILDNNIMIPGRLFNTLIRKHQSMDMIKRLSQHVKDNESFIALFVNENKFKEYLLTNEDHTQLINDVYKTIYYTCYDCIYDKIDNGEFESFMSKLNYDFNINDKAIKYWDFDKFKILCDNSRRINFGKPREINHCSFYPKHLKKYDYLNINLDEVFILVFETGVKTYYRWPLKDHVLETLLNVYKRINDKEQLYIKAPHYIWLYKKLECLCCSSNWKSARNSA